MLIVHTYVSFNVNVKKKDFERVDFERVAKKRLYQNIDYPNDIWEHI